MTILENLKRLNRKERYWLLACALNDDREMRLGGDFRAELSDACDGLPIPADAWVAMDYHLDWLYAALMADVTTNEPPLPLGEHPSIRATQEDVDLVVAFEEGEKTHLILIEAKGEGAWSNKQFRSKSERLMRIFPESTREPVQAYFVLCSPRPSKKLATSGLPEWIAPPGRQPRHMLLGMPSNLVQVERCDKDGNRTAGGGYWHIAR